MIAGSPGFVPSASAEVLNVVGLKENERIVATTISVGPGYLLRRIYSITGGAGPVFTAIEEESHYDGKKKELPDGPAPIGSTGLLPEEVAGLDFYLTFLRQEYRGQCYARDTIDLDYYRDGTLIGSESFEDKTCVATWFTWRNGEVRVRGDSFRDFPPEALKSMRTFLLVEQRIWRERKEE